MYICIKYIYIFHYYLYIYSDNIFTCIYCKYLCMYKIYIYIYIQYIFTVTQVVGNFLQNCSNTFIILCKSERCTDRESICNFQTCRNEMIYQIVRYCVSDHYGCRNRYEERNFWNCSTVSDHGTGSTTDGCSQRCSSILNVCRYVWPRIEWNGIGLMAAVYQ